MGGGGTRSLLFAPVLIPIGVPRRGSGRGPRAGSCCGVAVGGCIAISATLSGSAMMFFRFGGRISRGRGWRWSKETGSSAVLGCAFAKSRWGRRVSGHRLWTNAAMSFSRLRRTMERSRWDLWSAHRDGRRTGSRGTALGCGASTTIKKILRRRRGSWEQGNFWFQAGLNFPLSGGVRYSGVGGAH